NLRASRQRLHQARPNAPQIQGALIMRMTHFNRAVLFVATLLALPGAAFAGSKIKFVETIDVDPKHVQGPGELPQLPHLKMKIGTNAVGLKASDFIVTTEVEGKQIGVPAERATPFRDSDEELDIVILVQGSVRFMGDPNPEDGGEANEIKGYYNEVKQS